MRYVLIIFLMCSINCSAQKWAEAEFIGDVRAICSDSTTIKLEKSFVESKTKASGSLLWFGLGSRKSFFEIEGTYSTVRLPDTFIGFIIRVANNDLDPMSQIRIFSMVRHGEKRRVQTRRENNVVGNARSELGYISFAGQKYGKSSYIITPNTKFTDGEYCVYVSNPELPGTTNVVLNAFGVGQPENRQYNDAKYRVLRRQKR